MALKSRMVSGLAALIAVAGIACSTVSTATIPPPIPTLTQAPAPTQVPTPSQVPTATSAPEPAAVSTVDLADTALGYVTELAEGLGPRESSTEQEKAAAEFLESQFASLGYSVETQPFTAQRFSLEESGLFVGPEPAAAERIEAFPLSGSGGGEVSGVLASIGLGQPEDIPEAGLEGKIALVERGIIPFGEKARNARDAGAIGAVIYNNEAGNFRGDLGRRTDIPVVSIGRIQGQRLEGLASASGEVRAAIRIEVLESPSQNVVAEKPGAGDEVVILGAHYDTVRNVPGANDNASGTGVLLTLAQALSDKAFPFIIRFIAFGSEETGLLGSQAYVESLSPEQQGQIIAMLNFDALGSGNRLEVSGDQELTSLVAESEASQTIDVEVSPGLTRGNSDHASFAVVGIPVVMFVSNDFSRIHTPQDTLAFINPELLGSAARLALNLLDSLAQAN